MATLNLTDNFGLVIDATLDPGSALARYLKNPQAIIGALRNPKPIQDLRISDDPFQSQTIGVAFTQPIALGTTGVELTINPSIAGTIGISKGSALFDADSDPFRESVSIPPQGAYLGAALTAELNITVADNVASLQFGFAKGTTIILTNYQLCALADPVVPTLQRAFRQFTIPRDLQDIEGL